MHRKQSVLARHSNCLRRKRTSRFSSPAVTRIAPSAWTRFRPCFRFVGVLDFVSKSIKNFRPMVQALSLSFVFFATKPFFKHTQGPSDTSGISPEDPSAASVDEDLAIAMRAVQLSFVIVFFYSVQR